MTDTAHLPKSNWTFPVPIRFGVGRIAELPKCCKSLGIARPLLITDPGLARSSLVRAAVDANAAGDLDTEVFADIKPNPCGGNVTAGVTAYREGGHDGIIAFGGGSGMDAAKAIAAMVDNEADLWDMDALAGGWRELPGAKIAPMVGVPTTAGTGAEVSTGAMITDEVSHEKKVIFHPDLMPKMVISDPALTVGLPADLTAWTGLDALTHAVEAYLAPGYHPMADGIALEAMALIKTWLPVAHRDGGNLEARGHMLVAASMGAVAFQKGLGLVHAMSHTVGGLYDTQHGLTNAVFLPYVLEFNRDAINDKIGWAARYLDAGNDLDGFLGWLMGFRAGFGIPHTAAELGVKEERIDEMAEIASRDLALRTNPVKAGIDDIAKVYADAIEGVL